MRRRHSDITEVNFTEFRGLSNYLASNRVDNRFAYYGKNVTFDQGKIKSSIGHDPFLAALSGTTDYRSLSKYKHSTGGVTTEYLATLYDKEWYVVNTEDNTRTALSAALSTDEDTDTGQYLSNLYAVSPTVGGGKISSPTTYAAVADIPLGSMIEFAWEKMWVTGVIGNEATLYGSRTATASNPTYVEDFTTGAQTELVGKGGANTALRFLQDTLYIFKSDSVHFVRPEVVDSSTTLYLPKPFSLTGGAVNHRSTIVVENDIWFLTPDLQIRKLGLERDYLGDKRTNDISDIIRGMIDELAPDQSGAVAHYHNKIFTLALAEKGSSINNIIITYNYDNRGWGVDRFPSVKQWATANNKVFMAQTGSGQLYRDRFGYSFGGNFEIPFEVRMPFIDFQNPDNNYRNRRLYIRGVRSKGVPVTVRLYRGDYDTYTDYQIPEPTAAEMGTGTAVSSPFGKVKYGAKPWGGSSVKATDKPAAFVFEKHISTSHISNMFAVGILAELKGQRIEVEQLKMGLLPASTQPFNL